LSTLPASPAIARTAIPFIGQAPARHLEVTQKNGMRGALPARGMPLHEAGTFRRAAPQTIATARAAYCCGNA
jgi:hypothetical protein